MKPLLVLAVLGLSACAADPAALDASTRKVSLGAQTYLISQLTASTWTATASPTTKPLAIDGANRAALLDAIEKASGCKVTDSDYSRQGMQLDAQIDCGTRLKN